MNIVFESKKQKGVVLVITLVLLLIVTLLASSSVQLSTIYGRMARNITDTNVAFRAAEAALLEAEAIAEAETSLTAYQANAEGKYEIVGITELPRWDDPDVDLWSGTNSVAVTYGDGASQPRYIIEFVKTLLSEDDRLNLDNVGGGSGADRTQVFRIIARGTGKTNSAEVLLQSTYGKKF